MCENKVKIRYGSIIYGENDMIIEEGGDSAPALVRKARWLGEQVTMSKELKDDETLRICRKAVEIALKAAEKEPSYSTAHKVVAIIKG
jgi:formylmethanofuran dehydrogenase subunit E